MLETVSKNGKCLMDPFHIYKDARQEERTDVYSIMVL